MYMFAQCTSTRIPICMQNMTSPIMIRGREYTYSLFTSTVVFNFSLQCQEGECYQNGDDGNKKRTINLLLEFIMHHFGWRNF